MFDTYLRYKLLCYVYAGTVCCGKFLSTTHLRLNVSSQCHLTECLRPHSREPFALKLLFRKPTWWMSPRREPGSTQKPLPRQQEKNIFFTFFSLPRKTHRNAGQMGHATACILERLCHHALTKIERATSIRCITQISCRIARACEAGGRRSRKLHASA